MCFLVEPLLFPTYLMVTPAGGSRQLHDEPTSLHGKARAVAAAGGALLLMHDFVTLMCCHYADSRRLH